MTMIFNDDESYALFLVMDTLARSLNGDDKVVNHFRNLLLPAYREWHAANQGRSHPPLMIDEQVQ